MSGLLAFLVVLNVVIFQFVFLYKYETKCVSLHFSGLECSFIPVCELAF